jgi:putative ABC transport system permease protein
MMRTELGRALAALLRRPGATLVAVISIAVGLGANVAVLGWAWGVLFHERETPESRRLLWVAVVEWSPGGPSVLPPPDEALGFLAGGSSWDAVGAWDGALVTVEGAGGSVREWIRWVTPGFFANQGITAAAGRLIAPGDTLPGAEPVTLLSHGRAVGWFGSAAAALGHTVRVNGVPRVVVGVIGPEWDAGETGVHLPLAMGATRGRDRVRLWVRLPDASRAMRVRADAEIRVRLASLRTEDGGPVGVRTGSEKAVLRADQSLDAGTFVLPLAILLVACANVAMVLLARGATRVPELATRRMLGATSWDVVRPLLVEGAILATAAGALALAAAELAFRTVLTAPGPDAPGLGAPVLVAAALLVVVVVIGTGAWPALVAVRVGVADVLRTSVHTVTRHRDHRLYGVLLAVETALAVALVVTASETVRHATLEARRGVGYDPEHLVQADVDLGTIDGGARTLAGLVEDLSTAPRVLAVGAMALRPLPERNSIDVDGAEVQLPASIPPTAPRMAWITAGLRRTLGLRLLEGRDPDVGEFTTDAPVALVNETAARLLFRGRPPVGKRLRVADGAAAASTWLTVVGVVSDVRDQPLFQREAPVAIYTPCADAVGSVPARVFVRTNGDLTAVSEALRRSLERIMPDGVPRIRTTAEEVRREMGLPRLEATVAGASGGFALLLTCLGVFGLTLLTVNRERRALAVRAALGASPLWVVLVALSRVGGPVAAGATAGIVLRVMVAPLVGGMVPHGAAESIGAWSAAFGVIAVGLSVALVPAIREAFGLVVSGALRDD